MCLKCVGVCRGRKARYICLGKNALPALPTPRDMGDVNTLRQHAAADESGAMNEIFALLHDDMHRMKEPLGHHGSITFGSPSTD